MRETAIRQIVRLQLQISHVRKRGNVRQNILAESVDRVTSKLKPNQKLLSKEILVEQARRVRLMIDYLNSRSHIAPQLFNVRFHGEPVVRPIHFYCEWH